MGLQIPFGGDDRELSEIGLKMPSRVTGGRCCTPKFALSYLKVSSWTLRIASVKFKVSDYNFPRKSFTRAKWSKAH